MTLPAHCYQDPAIVVERNELKALGCRACASHDVYLGKVVCTNDRVTNHKKVPRIGSNCKFFILEVRP